jgi:hypothetical protein
LDLLRLDALLEGDDLLEDFSLGCEGTILCTLKGEALQLTIGVAKL